ncbi:serine/threonine protein kinase [Oculatella sp. LEGE 06141]|uniref:serine/threonine-protein kinase n=1 Tax=Oculatella sp. LEGE 06141 TaxID=1828648 RepID=UPI001881E196|nr:serine/threonine-protein kinase [Oculatella sp. LEGE 06141]MBE9179219.1 serine/threonine protein kinase [Oculatella sp. LEGE 06141]
MADSNIGRRLINRYQLVGLLGQGAMGRVYEARDMLLGGVPVAVKFLAQALMNQKMRDRFEREAMTCALLGQRSIHIVRVTDYGVDEGDGVPFYVMEYLQGESLSQLISRQPLSLPRFLSFCRQICLGLQCAHHGIVIDDEICPVVHRDVKPSNILISHDTSLGELAKVLDFGIAKMLQADGDQTSCFMGTLAYSSPEQMEGRELDARSDIYSLGVMMFQMLTGKMPLSADTHSFGGWYKVHHFQAPQSFETANASVRLPKALESLVMSCLAKSADDRPQNITEILRSLEPLEQRFGTGRQIGQRIGAALSKLPVTTTPKMPSQLSAEEVCRLASWPSNMPVAEIVFPKALPTSKGVLATLWVMLPSAEVDKRLVCTRYNQFLFSAAPYPLLLWLTVLYSHRHGPRWLPCYLDLRTAQGQQLSQLLGQSGAYRLLFFASEEPQRCAHVLTSTIAPAQCKMLQDWAVMGRTASGNLQLNGVSKEQTKERLKAALEEIKPKIVMKLQSLYGDEADISN